MRWDIGAAGVAGVLAKLQPDQDALTEDAAACRNTLALATSAAGGLHDGRGSGPLSTALSELAERAAYCLADLEGRAISCAEGARQATDAYHHGDIEMEENANRAHGDTAPPLPFLDSPHRTGRHLP
ncbi:DUF6507 family protein [Streptomyces sp. SM12]|uniref:DUF6507 family protein n=2 Tax=unclassified Streptomyces TaxID=2593676 RepID=UPI000CD5A657|nr:DUF6507 family protein [Streptomyces sp. SM12]